VTKTRIKVIEKVGGIVLKRDMSDGWTETTATANLSRVKAIYEEFGGILNDENVE
jgi:hypothetical protein